VLEREPWIPVNRVRFRRDARFTTRSATTRLMVTHHDDTLAKVACAVDPGESPPTTAAAMDVLILYCRSEVLYGSMAASHYPCRLLLSRPDQHVAWCGAQAPDDPVALIDRVRGADAGT